ncbi:maleylpyruvate isomerase family mycothiol-dependent enzyme [Marihabitans asiaticum]|uniref:Uncharacterized protein (TIGR03086 family) n=1 Tax=Marihabitans asiaticum TaxID=415218 RepID=A0A560WDA8_9MICO|nr:TIGR03086 family metal-binding protein [Marihabitans asiaticum]TWD15659.1 uncharacterized protein (TIGR03086 family) [Marihabitans asiaticum]
MSRLTDATPAERYRLAAATFSDRVRGTRDWDAPTPVEQWLARDVVGHLTTWFPQMLEGGSEITLVPIPSAVDDPPAAWAGLDGQVQALLEDPASEGVAFTHEDIGSMPLPEMIDRYFTSDVVFHTWDLARATGQHDELDEDYIADAYDGMRQMEDVIRGSGQFGEHQPVPEDASVQDQFLAFIGRDPRWQPPAE